MKILSDLLSSWQINLATTFGVGGSFVVRFAFIRPHLPWISAYVWKSGNGSMPRSALQRKRQRWKPSQLELASSKKAIGSLSL